MDTDTRNVPDDKYARESFTWRRMKRWQVWAIAAAAVVFVLIALLLRY